MTESSDTHSAHGSHLVKASYLSPNGQRARIALDEHRDRMLLAGGHELGDVENGRGERGRVRRHFFAVK
jgi:hypothetical protein